MADKSGYAGLSQLARAYVGGLLAHAPALLAFCAPTTNSYRRLVPGYEAPVNLVYSQRNRSACIRIPMYSDSPKAKRIEFRCPDAAANPYLAFSAMLMAGPRRDRARARPGRAGRLRPLRGGRDGTSRRCRARSPRRSTRSRPTTSSCSRAASSAGADRDVDRLEARARGRRRPAPAAPGRVLPLLTTRDRQRRALTVEALTAGDWPAVSGDLRATGSRRRQRDLRDGGAVLGRRGTPPHLSEHRLVAARRRASVLGWAALSPRTRTGCALRAAWPRSRVYVAEGGPGSRRRPQRCSDALDRGRRGGRDLDAPGGDLPRERRAA